MTHSVITVTVYVHVHYVSIKKVNECVIYFISERKRKMRGLKLIFITALKINARAVKD